MDPMQNASAPPEQASGAASLAPVGRVATGLADGANHVAQADWAKRWHRPPTRHYETVGRSGIGKSGVPQRELEPMGVIHQRWQHLYRGEEQLGVVGQLPKCG